MKKIILLIVVILFISCETEKDVIKDIDRLRIERDNLRRELTDMRNEFSQLQPQLAEARIVASGRTPKYVIKFRLRQSRVSLDLFEHAKDAMNAIEFELPVDKDFFDRVRVGQEIVDEFRMGSLVMNGSFGSWKMNVVSKTIK